MARVLNTNVIRNRNVRIRVRTDRMSTMPVGDIVLVPGGRRAYLWIGPANGNGSVYTVSGVAALKAIARSILLELPPYCSAPPKQKAKR